MGRINRKVVLIFYGALLLAALIWAWLRGEPNLLVNPDYPYSITMILVLKGVLIGVLTAGIFVVLSRLASNYFAWSRKLELHFASLLGRLSYTDIVLIALSSGVAEEAFFRGAMQPALGIFISSVIFGLLHIGPRREFIPWTVSALVIGVVLGYYVDALGTLAAPITAHILINLINLIILRMRYEIIMKP